MVQGSTTLPHLKQGSTTLPLLKQGSTTLPLLKQGLHLPTQVCVLPFADQAGTMHQGKSFVTTSPLTVLASFG